MTQEQGTAGDLGTPDDAAPAGPDDGGQPGGGTPPASGAPPGDAGLAAAAGLPEQMQVRLAKAGRMRAAGIDPYPVGYPRTHTIGQVRDEFGELPPDTTTGREVGVAGRVMLSRNGGKLCFAVLRDGTGEMQVMISLAGVGEEALAAWKADVDLGDHVGVTGEVIASR